MFNKFPINYVRSKTDIQLLVGYEAITSQVVHFIEGRKTSNIVLAFDGSNGADYLTLLQKLTAILEKRNYVLNIQCTSSYLKSGTNLRELFKENITDNRAFGFVTEAEIADYFAEGAKEELKNTVSSSCKGENSISIVFGPGSYWLCDGICDLLCFLDVSREYQQIEYKKQLLNFGMDWNKDFVEKYKIAYFVEWPILENYRKNIFDKIDFYLDLNNPKNPVAVQGKDLVNIIHEVVQAPIRVKPFYAPGVWGGQRLKELADLPKEWVNCAWQFEPIAPENSILIGVNQYVIEVPFLIVMAQEYINIMGERPVRLFGDYFPIRFDYLDTIDGDNLSCQVHPKQAYLKKHFNEKMPQQESYYIMEKKDNSKVYLGLTNNTNEENFKNAVINAQNTGIPFEFTDYVNEFDSNIGDLFLIPTGTVHCSGKNNLVLEISSTTWWFTFKIFDFLRKDLDGKPRPINIEHGFNNIDFYKKTDWVKENLIPEPRLINVQNNNKEYLLGQRKDLLFYVKRVHLIDKWMDDTEKEFVMYNLVKGEKVRIVSLTDETIFVEMSYAESYIIPSTFGKYKIVNIGSVPCQLIKAGVSPEWEVIYK